MAIVLGVMAAKEGPKAVAEVAMNIAVLPQCGIVAQHNDARLDISFAEGGSLAHEAFDQALMALGEHGGDRIPFGLEVEEQEIVVVLIDRADTVGGNIDI